MGAADNKTYKNTTHFNARFRNMYNDPTHNPSVYHEPGINTTIKENPDRSNVEIEEDELVLKPDLTAIFKARGKKHSQGGIDVSLENDSFIFSDDKSLKFTDHELKLHELEGHKSKNKNTPANILKKNVNIKHYNTLFNILNEPFKDDLAKSSSALMLEKYIGKIGQIGYVQEKKKGLPDGVPDFAQGSAPVYDTELKEDIMEQKQYMKYGGKVKMQTGGMLSVEESYRRYLESLKAKGTLPPVVNDPTRRIPTTMQDYINQIGQPGEPMRSESSTPYLYPHTPGLGDFRGRSSFDPFYGDPRMHHSTGDYAEPMLSQEGAATGKPAVAKTPRTGTPAQKGVIAPDTDEITAYAGDKNWKGNKSMYSSEEWRKFAKDIGFTGKGNRAFQEFLFNMNGDVNEDGSLKPNFQDIIIGLHDKYGNPLPPPDASQANNWFDARLGHRWDAVMDAYYKNKPNPETTRTGTATPEDYNSPAPQPQAPALPQVPNITGSPQGAIEANWQFTPWQRVSQGYNAAKYATLRRHMPARSRYQASYIDPALVNPEQTLGDMRTAANAQTAAVRGSQNPVLANAQTANIYGQLLDQMPQVRSQYDNQNAQITNQFRGINNQTRNQESMVNMQNDQNYYKESVIGRQNFENMRSYLADNYMNNVMRDVESNQSLAYNMLTMNNPAYGFDFKTGNFNRKPVNIQDVQGIDSTDTVEALGVYAKKLLDSGLPPETVNAIIKSKTFSQMAPYMGAMPSFGQMTGKSQKKGGKFRSMRK